MRSHPLVRLVIILVLLFPMSVVVCCNGGPKVTISTLTVAPSELVPEQTVTIGANLLNSGTKTEEYSAVLKINDNIIETKQVQVGAGETKTLSLQYVPQNIGLYQVDVNGQTGSFNVVKPATFVVESLTVSPRTPVPGSEVTASVQVSNTGGLSGKYIAGLKVDGRELKTTEITLDPGGSQTVTFTFSSNTTGSHVIEVGDKKSEINILKPAEFRGTSVTVTPASVVTGETVTIEATITNDGEVKDTKSVALIVNGIESDSQTLTLEPGASDKVSFTLTRDSSGTYNVDVMGATGSFTVIELAKYTNKSYFYSISYPPDFSVNETNPQNITIAKTGIGGISIIVEWVSTTATPKDYFDSVAQARKNQRPDWTLISQSDIIEDGTVIGYKYNYSYTVDGKKWLGRGTVIKKAGFGYYVGFSTSESEWEKNKALAQSCVDSFVPPRSFSGSYSSPSLGIALTLPEGWTATESGNTNLPVYLFSTREQSILGYITVASVATGTSAKQYVDGDLESAVAKGWVQGTGTTFTFSDGAVGYETSLSGTTTSGVTYKYRIFGLVKDGRGIVLIFFAQSANINAQASSITPLARSLVVSKPGGVAGVDRNEALFLWDADIPTLDPAIVETGPGDIVGAVFSGLVRIDRDLKVVPDLAESWKVSDDGRTYTFYLRKNATFHDGKQVTAADVKYSWERACDPAVDSPKASSFLADIIGAKERLAGTTSAISGIKVVDDHTLEVTIDAAKPYFLGELAQPVAFIVDKANVARGDKWYEQPNGTGPFKLKSWEKDTLIVLERNDNFYLEPAKLKNIVFKLFAGNTMQLYENGEIDITAVSTFNQDKVLDPTNPLNKELVTGSSYDVSYVGFNVTKPPFDDTKIRQALAMALDVPKLIDVTLKGRADRATGFVPPGIPGNNPALQPIAFDLEGAKQLIKESKYQSADQVPPITIYTAFGVGSTEQAIIGMWQALGLQVNTQVITNLEDYYASFHRKEFHVYISGWRADYIDPQNFLEIFFQSQSPQNGFAYNNPEVDTALAKAAAEQDEATRLKMYQDIEKVVLNDLPAIPLWWSMKTYTLVKPYVKGYSTFPIDINIWRDLSVTPH